MELYLTVNDVAPHDTVFDDRSSSFVARGFDAQKAHGAPSIAAIFSAIEWWQAGASRCSIGGDVREDTARPQETREPHNGRPGPRSPRRSADHRWTLCRRRRCPGGEPQEI